MSYQRFDFSKISLPAATLATPATLPVETAPTVANVATVAGVELESRDPADRTVADVASVAGQELKSGSLSVSTPGPGVRIVAPAREVSARVYDDALDQMITAAADPERARPLWAKRKGACVEVNGETTSDEGEGMALLVSGGAYLHSVPFGGQAGTICHGERIGGIFRAAAGRSDLFG